MDYILRQKLTASGDDGYVVYDTTSFDNSSSSALLGWEFYGDTGDCNFFINYSNIPIPKGSTIKKATLVLSVWACHHGYVNSRLNAEKDGVVPTSYSEFLALNPSVEYTQLHIPDGLDEKILTFNVKNIVAEIIEADDWYYGKNICFFSSDTEKESSGSGVDFDTYDYSNINTLIITYEPQIKIDLKDILNGPRIEFYEYEKIVLSYDNTNYESGEDITNYVESCNISSDFTRDIIGNISLVIKDYDINYLTDLIRPYFCIQKDGETYKFPMGTYMLSFPSKQSDGKLVSRNIQGFDLLLAVDQDKTTESITYAAGTNVINTVVALLESVGDWVTYNVQNNDSVLSEDMSYELGRSKLFIINSLLNAINYYPLYCDGNGVYCAIPWSANQNIVWEFEDNQDSLYESGIEAAMDYSDIYNKVVIVSNELEEDTEPIVSILTFEDLGMDDYPLSYTMLGRYITKIFNSETVTQEYADLRAERELRKMLEIEESVNYSHAFVTNDFSNGLPKQGDCFSFKNTLLDLNSVYKIQSQQFKLKVGESVSSIIRRINND